MHRSSVHLADIPAMLEHSTEHAPAGCQSIARRSQRRRLGAPSEIGAMFPDREQSTLPRETPGPDDKYPRDIRPTERTSNRYERRSIVAELCVAIHESAISHCRRLQHGIDGTSKLNFTFPPGSSPIDSRNIKLNAPPLGVREIDSRSVCLPRQIRG